MSREYWDKKHAEDFDGDWAYEATPFAKYALDFFPKVGKILEIGAGKGGDANFFQTLGYEVTATDYSSTALQIAEENFPKVKFINLDTSSGLPFPDESFEVVYAFMSLHYFDKKTTHKVFEDIHRVLKTGGVFATVTNTTKDPKIKDKGYIELEPDLYKNAEKNITRRYFSVDSMQEFTQDLFEIIILDSKGETPYRDIKNLIRFVGRKI